MRVLKINDLKETPMDTATPIAGWTGGAVSRTRQAVIGDGQSDNFRCNVVNFRVGATTGWHVHDCDQILVVTAGKGFRSDGIRTARNYRRRYRAYQSRRAPLAWRVGGVTAVAYHRHDDGQHFEALGICGTGPSSSGKLFRGESFLTAAQRNR